MKDGEKMSVQKRRTVATVLDELLAESKKETARIKNKKQDLEKTLDENGPYKKDENGLTVIGLNGKPAPTTTFELYEYYSQQYMGLLDQQTKIIRDVKADQAKQRTAAKKSNGQLTLGSGGGL